MPVRNTACPYCGGETMVNVPDRETTVTRVEKATLFNSIGSYDTKAACRNCGKEINVYYG
jgi:hypothetical protein